MLGLHRQHYLPHLSVDFDALGNPTTMPRRGSSPLEVLVVARLVPEKNLSALVRAVQTPEFREEVRLTIVGGGPEQAQLQQLITNANVSLLGARPWNSLGDLFRRSDVVVLSSVREAWGLTVVEALGMGVPVLATPEAGAASSMAGHFGGVRLTTGTTERELAAGLRDVLANYSSLSDAAQRDAPAVRTAFHVRNIASAMAERLRHLTR
jgi:glycosyltransferase involved in cell wall biosynthesis